MTIRHLLVAGAAIASLAVAAASRAGDITYPNLNAATNVQDTDILATWRASGPLTRVPASALEAYIQGKLGGSFLQTSNNLSELTATAATARGNLGLGSAALAATGTTGTALCQLNSNCTWTGTEAFNAAVTMGSTLGVTGLLSAAGGEAITGNLTVSGTTTDTGLATFNGGLTVASGATSLGGTLSVTGNVTFSGGLGVVGNIAAAGLQATANGLNVTGGFVLNNGTFTVPAGSITGSEIASGTIASANIANGAVTNAQHANMAASTIKGNASGSAAAPQDLSVSQALNLLGLVSSGSGRIGSVTIPTSNANIIINWGVDTAMGGGSSSNSTLTTSYPNNAIAIATGSSTACGAQMVSNSQVQIHNTSGGVQDCYWMTIGS